MARKVKIDSDTLISLINQFYIEECDSNAQQLRIPQIGEYVRSKGFDIADYLIRRNEKAKAYIKRLQESSEEFHINTVSVYRDLDLDAFLIKNNTKEKLKQAIKERESHYREIANSATYSFKENKLLKQQEKEFKKQVEELKEELKAVKNDCDFIRLGNGNYKVENKKLREIIKTYVYPEISNELLKKQGLLKETADIVNAEIIESEIVTAETNVSNIKSNIIRGLFDKV